MSDKPDTLDQPIISINNFIKVVVLLGALYVNNQDIKQSIRDEIVDRKAEDRIIINRLDAIEGKHSSLPAGDCPKISALALPSPIQLRPYKFKIYKLRA